MEIQVFRKKQGLETWRVQTKSVEESILKDATSRKINDNYNKLVCSLTRNHTKIHLIEAADSTTKEKICSDDECHIITTLKLPASMFTRSLHGEFVFPTPDPFEMSDFRVAEFNDSYVYGGFQLYFKNMYSE